ncbi:MAG: hypothetical protein ACXADY_04590 [Candidatus Hodarchaeales archaeon]|jgi:hypothetical protein
MSNTESPQQPKKYQDIINYKPEVLKVINDQEDLKILSDNNYEKIMGILRKKPMTVQEITEAFNKLAETCPLTESKTNKSIYRYLKILKERKMLATAGQRVVIGKIATEKLYTPTARIFQRKDIDWMSERGEQWAKRFILLMGYMTDSRDREPSIRCIQEFFEKRSMAKIEAFERLAKTASNKTLELINEGEWEELVEFIDWVYIFGSLMNQPDLLKQLGDCFKITTSGD